MIVLAINCGSSSLKFQLIQVGAAADDRDQRLAGGTVDRIGARARLEFAAGGDQVREDAAVADHEQAVRRVLDWLGARGLVGSEGIDVVGHRVVHGGGMFSEPALVDDEVVDAIESVSSLAPLHNGPALAAIRAARAGLGPDVPMVATFDTAFHHTLPECAAGYAIPPDLAAKHRVRRYGFHGIAVRAMLERYPVVSGRPVERARLIVLQLGNGCSATAVAGGHSVDTSMGFTPLEGLMMGTRSGDVDPSLAGFLARREGVDVEVVEGWLNTRSGLLGVSGRSRDMRELLEAEGQGDPRAALAVEMFCYRVRKYIGAYLAVLGGADAILFGGGIGERAPTVRARICAGLDWAGLRLDETRNAWTIASEGPISPDDAPVQVYVIRVDEAMIIARDTARCIQQTADGGDDGPGRGR